MARRREVLLQQVLGDAGIGQEARVVPGDPAALRLWLRLMSCSAQIEREIRDRLRQRCATTLPRFDYLAQLERHPQGLRMNTLSRYLMVTGGNVTALTRQLVADGWVERVPDPVDGRSQTVRLTAAGRRAFARIAAEHHAALERVLSGFDPADRDRLYEILGRLRVHLAGAAEPPRAVRARRPKPLGG